MEGTVLNLLEVKHKDENDYQIVGIFNNSSDVLVAKVLYLKKKNENGFQDNEFFFKENILILGNIIY